LSAEWDRLTAAERGYWLDRALMVLGLVARRRWERGEEPDDELRRAC
jgi:hypothetical protein